MTNKKTIGKAISSSKKVTKKTEPTVTVKTKKVNNETEMSCCGTSCSETKTFIIHIIIFVLIILNVGSSIFLYFNNPVNRLEIMKVGWRENFEKTVQIYKNSSFAQQQKQYLESVLEQMDSTVE